MPGKSPIAGTSAEWVERKKTAKKAYWQKAAVLVPVILIMGYRQRNAFSGGVGFNWVTGLTILSVAVVTAVGIVCMLALRRRKVRRVGALAGPGCWVAQCADPDDLKRWQVLLLDATGVHSVNRSGVASREWTWESIREVSVERFPVDLGIQSGVVLYLADGSRAEVLLLGGLTAAAARAEPAANEIRQRLAAFHGEPTHPELLAQ